MQKHNCDIKFYRYYSIYKRTDLTLFFYDFIYKPLYSTKGPNLINSFEGKKCNDRESFFSTVGALKYSLNNITMY